MQDKRRELDVAELVCHQKVANFDLKDKKQIAKYDHEAETGNFFDKGV